MKSTNVLNFEIKKVSKKEIEFQGETLKFIEPEKKATESLCYREPKAPSNTGETLKIITETPNKIETLQISNETHNKGETLKIKKKVKNKVEISDHLFQDKLKNQLKEKNKPRSGLFLGQNNFKNQPIFDWVWGLISSSVSFLNHPSPNRLILVPQFSDLIISLHRLPPQSTLPFQISISKLAKKITPNFEKSEHWIKKLSETNPNLLKTYNFDNLLNSYWFTGYLEANLTSFSINFLTSKPVENKPLRKKSRYKRDHQIQFEIKIMDRNLTNLLILNKNFFKGKILSVNSGYKLIKKMKFGDVELKNLIIFLENFNLLSLKRIQFLKIRKIYRICQRKEDFYHRGNLKILSIWNGIEKN